MKTRLALDYSAILANTAQPVHLALTFDAPATLPPRPQPVAFVVVLDRSGSMEGPPLESAKQAAETVVRNLRPGDWFGLVVFDSEAQTVIPLADTRDLNSTLRTIRDIRSGSSTNLTGGWSLGRDLLARAPKACPRKLLLLTDGQANVGITDPHRVGHLVGQARERTQIRTSCLGFGDGYSEDLLRLLATASGGELHDANDPERLPEIFSIELDGLQSVAVQNLRVTTTLAPSVERVELLGSYPAPLIQGAQREYAIGDLVSGEQRVIVFALGVLPIPLLGNGQPAATWDGEKLLNLTIRCDVITATGVEIREENHEVNVRPVQDPSEVTFNVEVVSWVSLQAATAVVDRAIRQRDEGKVNHARLLLTDEMERLSKLPPHPLIEDAKAVLKRALDSMDDDDTYFSARKALYSMVVDCSRGSSHPSTRGRVSETMSFKRPRPKSPPPSQPASGSSTTSTDQESGSDRPEDGSKID